MANATFTVGDVSEPCRIEVALVEMLMAVQDQINAVINEGRLERGRLIS